MQQAEPGHCASHAKPAGGTSPMCARLLRKGVTCGLGAPLRHPLFGQGQGEVVHGGSLQRTGDPADAPRRRWDPGGDRKQTPIVAMARVTFLVSGTHGLLGACEKACESHQSCRLRDTDRRHISTGW